MNGIQPKGFTLVELVLILAVVAILSTLGIAGFMETIERTKNDDAIADLRLIEVEIVRFYTPNNEYPGTLDQIGLGDMEDPWGNPYVYTNIDVLPQNKKGKITGPKKGADGEQIRRDKNLNPLNTDYDLYSLGRDGESKAQITYKTSLDDIIRAGNGSFVGLAEDF